MAPCSRGGSPSEAPVLGMPEPPLRLAGNKIAEVTNQIPLMRR